MSRAILVTLICSAIGLIAWAFSTHGKEGTTLFFLGVAMLLCTLTAALWRTRSEPSSTNFGAVFGALMGMLIGGLAGARLGLGQAMISIFNPELPERDFGMLFGAIGGALLGAFLLALLAGTVWSWFGQRQQR